MFVQRAGFKGGVQQAPHKAPVCKAAFAAPVAKLARSTGARCCAVETDSKPVSSTRIPGLQDFAGGVWERRRRIPSNLYQDPLVRLFDEFDKDADGHLTADEISCALASKNVTISSKQVQVYIDRVDKDGNGMIERAEFADLVFNMATADLDGN